MKTLRLLAAGVVLPCLLYGALPPRYAAERKKYIQREGRRQRKRAPLVVVLQVCSVDRSGWQPVSDRGVRLRRTWRVKARVLRNLRGEYGRKTLSFRYTRRRYASGAVGPRLYNPLRLHKGRRYKVWLKNEDGQWVAAAGPLSFEAVKLD